MASRGEPDLSSLRIPDGARPQAEGPVGCACRGLALVLVLAGAGVGFLEADRRGLLPKKEVPPPPPPIDPSPIVRQPRDGPRQVMAPVIGYVVARRKAAVGSARAGLIKELLVDTGHVVKAGQPIARLDDALVKAELERVRSQEPSIQAEMTRIAAQRAPLEAEKARAEAVVADARRELARRKKLAAEGVAPAGDVEPAQGRVDVALTDVATVQKRIETIEVQVDEARARLKTLEAEAKIREEELVQCEVRAPFAGIVIAKHQEVGEATGGLPVPGQGATGGTPIVTIADLTNPEVEADVPEARIADLGPEQPCDVELEALGTGAAKLKGTLRMILPSADRRKATVPVRVTLAPAPALAQLRPDMSARVTFTMKPGTEPVVARAAEPEQPVVPRLAERPAPATNGRDPADPRETYRRSIEELGPKLGAAWNGEFPALRHGVGGLVLLVGAGLVLRVVLARRRRAAEAEPAVASTSDAAAASSSASEASASGATSSASDASSASDEVERRKRAGSSASTPSGASSSDPHVPASSSWSEHEAPSSDDGEAPSRGKLPRRSRASFRVTAVNSISDVESVDEIFVVDDGAEETQHSGSGSSASSSSSSVSDEKTLSMGERRVYGLGSDGRITKETWVLHKNRSTRDRSMLDLDGCEVVLVIEDERGGARLLPSSDAATTIEGIKVGKSGEPLVHGMVFSLDGRAYVYMDRPANDAERRRAWVVEVGEQSTAMAEKVLAPEKGRPPARRVAAEKAREAEKVREAQKRSEAPPLPADAQAIVSIRGLEKTYHRGNQPVRVLAGLDLDVPAGDFLALMGPSGSGKSTLLNVIAGIDRATAGSVRIAGQEITGLSEASLAAWRAHSVGFIFQFYNLIPVLSALENVELPLLLVNLSGKERRKRARHALELVGLADRASHLPRELSGGQEQRVAIARALVTDPVLLVGDEPTGDLDAENAEAILDLLVRLNRELEKTIIMVTHDPHAAERARHVRRLEKGKLLEEEP